MRRFFFCATSTSSRVLASANSALSRFCSETGDLGEFRASVFGDLRGGALRFEEIRDRQKRAENPQIFRAVNLVVGEFVRFLNRAVEIGADDVAVKIADDEQGRIEQRFAVAEKLLVSLVEVFLFALVFPGEAALFPHVGKAAFGRLAGVRVFRATRKVPRL